MYHISRLASLYEFYFIKPKLRKTWKELASQLADKKAQLEDDEITKEEFEEFFVPIQSQFDIRLMCFTMIDDISFENYDVRSVKSQTEFLKDCEIRLQNQKFPEIYYLFAELMISELKKVPLERIQISSGT